jgi:hypothetical protein
MAVKAFGIATYLVAVEGHNSDVECKERAWV